MKTNPPDFKEYITQIANLGKNEGRKACLEWLRQQELMGVLPVMNLQSALKSWHRFYLTMPAEHRQAAGRLWQEYVSYRRNSRYKGHRPKRRADKIRAQSAIVIGP